MQYVNFHSHGRHSILDGFPPEREIVSLTKSLGHPAAALTDHGSLAGALELWKAGRELEQPVVQGLEAYVCPDRLLKNKDQPTWHLVLLAKNREGFENLMAASQEAWVNGFYKKPRMDKALLSRYSDGLVCLSGCMASETSRAIERGDLDGAKGILLSYQEIFGEDFYVELQPGNSVELNEALASLAETLKLPTVVTVDSHYDVAANKPFEEMFLICQQLGQGTKDSLKQKAIERAKELPGDMPLLDKLNELWPERYLRYDAIDLWILSPQEVHDRMAAQGFDAKLLMDNTLKILDKCQQWDFELGKSYLPTINKFMSPQEYLTELVQDGLDKLGVGKNEKYLEKAAYELGIIGEKGFANYFLVVWAIVNYCHNNNIYVGPGRGSAAGSVVVWALGITSEIIDPIEYELLFERFLDPSRTDWPDIDVDIEAGFRDQVKEWARHTFGDVAGITTYGTYQAKGALKAACRALGLTVADGEKISNAITSMEDLKHSNIETVAGFRNRHPDVLLAAPILEGRLTSAGAHAGGLVIANQSFNKIVPIETRKNPDGNDEDLDRIPVTAFDMNEIAELGLIKMDLLGLVNLDIIHNTIDLIEQRHGIKLNWMRMQPNDERIFNELSHGRTLGVFQMESGQYRRLLMEMGVSSFKDMYASNALVRPGAYETIAKNYIARKNGREEVTYIHEVAEQFLKDTYGLVVFQEDLMLMAVHIGGFEMATVNKLRKIMGKKLAPEEFKPYFDQWMDGATRFVDAKTAERQWHDFEAFSGYAFNKSHAVAYSYISYVTAYLKLYYNLEYTSSVLSNTKKDKRMSYLMEAERLGTPIIGPDINDSGASMSIVGDGLQFGLSDIKGLASAAVQEIMDKRPYDSYEGFVAAVEPRKCSARVKSALINSGALRSLTGAPECVDHEDNWLELLSYPKGLERVYGNLGLDITSLEDIQEDTSGYFMIFAIVKSTKRTATYFRIELEDSTGTYTCFGDLNNDLKKGEPVFALVGNKTMLGYARAVGLRQRMANQSLTTFEGILFGQSVFDQFKLLIDLGIDDLYSDKCLMLPINTREFKTKNGQTMATSYVIDRYLNVQKLTFFAQQWADLKPIYHDWTPYCSRLQPLQRGSGYTIERGWLDRADLVLKHKMKEL